MFLKCHSRFKDGKEHRYWNIVENRRCGRGKFVQMQVLYLGEINDAQRQSWCRTIEIFDENRERTMHLALFRPIGNCPTAQRDGAASASAMGCLLARLLS